MNSPKNKIHFPLWNAIHRAPNFIITRWQLQRMKSLIGKTIAGVPLYQELWQKAGVDIKKIKSLDDIKCLPIIDKDTIRACSIEKATNKYFGGNYYWNQTSGSIGEPFRFLLSPPAVTFQDDRYNYSGAYRFLTWRGLKLRDIVNMKIVQIRINPRPSPNYLFIPISDIRNNPSRVLDKLIQFCPDTIKGAPTVLVELARAANNMPSLRNRICRYVISYSELLSSSQRYLIEKTFGGEVYDNYGIEEFGSVGLECKEHNGLHINEESLIVEIVDDNGAPVKNGVIGRVIITSLYNEIMPFIRYDTKDRGYFAKEPCPCGLRTKRLFVEGRIGAFLTLGQKKFHHAEFGGILRYFGNSILRYQIAKIADQKVELRIIPARDFLNAEIKNLKNKFLEKFGFNPEIKLVKELPYSERGKTKVITDESLK